jgi:hypothetical protein
VCWPRLLWHYPTSGLFPEPTNQGPAGQEDQGTEMLLGSNVNELTCHSLNAGSPQGEDVEITVERGTPDMGDDMGDDRGPGAAKPTCAAAREKERGRGVGVLP